MKFSLLPASLKSIVNGSRSESNLRYLARSILLRKTQHSTFIILSVFLPQFMYLRLIHSWEVDAHHDGIMYTAAVGFFQGLVPNRDFFAQYGPGAPVLQGLAFKLLEPNVWSLKLATSFLLALIGSLLFVGARRKLDTISSFCLSYLWVLSGPFGLPWSSIFTTTILVSCLLLIEFGNRKPSYLKIIFISVGILLGLGIFIRVHILASIFLLNLLLLLFRKRLSTPFSLIYLNFGFMVSLSIVLILQVISRSLMPFINQCIIWASNNYVGAPVLSISLVFDLLWIPLFGFFLLLLGFLFLKIEVLSHKLRISVLLFFASAFIFAVVLGNLERTGEQTLRNPKILLITASQKAQFSFQYLALIISIICFTFFLGKSLPLLLEIKKETKFSTFSVSYAAIGISSLAQLYPFADNYHIAFITPVLLLSSLFLLPNSVFKTRFQKSIILISATILPMLIFKFYLSANVDRKPFESHTLKGLHGSWNTSQSLDSTMRALELQVPGIDFKCADGLYAGAGGRYLALNEKFVTWGPTSDQDEASNKLFICYASKELIDSYKGLGWNVVFQIPWNPIDSSHKNLSWNVLLERL